MGGKKENISFPEQGERYKRETTNGYFDPTSVAQATQQKRNRKKVAKRTRLAKAGIKIKQQSTRAKEPVQSAAFKNGYRNS
jgi:hypothetical protein|tara:strand:+ start:690 stop:932 length:243 start_codon:yes stop_codon:yes gene_type:complete